MKKYICDTRVGCVGVYPEPMQNCLSLPMKFFTYYQHGKYTSGKGWDIPEWRMNEAHFVCNCLNHKNKFVRMFGHIYAKIHMVKL
jgi:hypothetical protein